MQKDDIPEYLQPFNNKYFAMGNAVVYGNEHNKDNNVVICICVRSQNSNAIANAMNINAVPYIEEIHE